jgi:hypothetical protein
MPLFNNKNQLYVVIIQFVLKKYACTEQYVAKVTNFDPSPPFDVRTMYY